MYVIIVYDVDVERVSKIHKFLRTYLHWIQNSVFEGEVSNAQMEEIRTRLKKLIKAEDSIIIFKLPSVKNMEREIIGKEKEEITNIL